MIIEKHHAVIRSIAKNDGVMSGIRNVGYCLTPHCVGWSVILISMIPPATMS